MRGSIGGRLESRWIRRGSVILEFHVDAYQEKTLLQRDVFETVESCVRSLCSPYGSFSRTARVRLDSETLQSSALKSRRAAP